MTSLSYTMYTLTLSTALSKYAGVRVPMDFEAPGLILPDLVEFFYR